MRATLTRWATLHSTPTLLLFDLATSQVVSMAGNRISEVAVRLIDPAEDTAAGSSPG